MRGIHCTIVVLLFAAACSAEAEGPAEKPAPGETWCCEVKAGNGNTRFSRSCGLTEEEAVSWMRDPQEVCWDDAL